jgi:hypothetical protein
MVMLLDTRLLIVAALVSCAGGLASGQQLVMDDVTATIPAGALPLLTTVRPQLPEKLVLLTFEWPSGRIEPEEESGCWEPAEASITIALGPSYGTEAHVANLIERAAGTLWVGADRRRWKIEQFNFGYFAARTGYDLATKRVSFFLPVVFLRSPSLDHDYGGGLHAVLGFSCRLDGGERVSCAGLHFVFQDPYAWEFFPEAPPLSQLLLPRPDGGS